MEIINSGLHFTKDNKGYIIDDIYVKKLSDQLKLKYCIHNVELSYITEYNAVWRCGDDVGSVSICDGLITKVVISDKKICDMRELLLYN